MHLAFSPIPGCFLFPPAALFVLCLLRGPNLMGINGTDIPPFFSLLPLGGVGKSCLTGECGPPQPRTGTHLDMGILKGPGLVYLSTQHGKMSCER